MRNMAAGLVSPVFAGRKAEPRVDLPALREQQAQPAEAAPFGLTERELEVLSLVAVGRGNRDIATELFIAPKTASVHVSNIFGKLARRGRRDGPPAAPS